MSEWISRANRSRKPAPGRVVVGSERELDDHVDLEMAIAGEVNPPHAPLANPAEDLVALASNFRADPRIAAGSQDAEPSSERIRADEPM